MQTIASDSQIYNTATITTLSPGISFGSVALSIDGTIRTPKVITVPRGVTQEAICVDTFDADNLPVTRCELLSSIGVPTEVNVKDIHVDPTDFIFIAGIVLIGVLASIAANIAIYSRKR
jgi:hypothetical protein